MAEEDQQSNASTGTGEKTIKASKIYTKDVSFETPNSPAVFLKKWIPKKSIDINSNIRAVAEDTYEVVASITVTVTIEDMTAYLAEVHQAGIFTISGFSSEELEHLHNIYCMEVLYPYAHAVLSDLVIKGGFPQLILAPFDFNEMYMKSRRTEADDQESTAE